MNRFSLAQKIRSKQKNVSLWLDNQKKGHSATERRSIFEQLEDRLALTLLVDVAIDSISENPEIATAIVTRTSDPSLPWVVDLSSNDSSATTVPPMVAINANEASSSGLINNVDTVVVLSDDVIALTRNPAGDVLSLQRGPQTGDSELIVGPASTLSAARPWYSVFAQDATYQSAGSNQTIQADDYIPVDVTKAYVLSGWAKSGDEYGQRYQPGNLQSFGVVAYDVDKLPILAEHVLRFPGAADTTLAAPLNPGDTTIQLNNATGWSNLVGDPNETRSLAWYGYQDSTGTTYADYTYTRNVAADGANGLWNAGGISGDTITLASAWNGPALPAGVAVRNPGSGGEEILVGLDSQSVPADWSWNQYLGKFGGQVLQNGNDSTVKFRPGTAYLQPLILANQHGSIGNFISWRNVALTQVPVNSFVEDLAIPILDLSDVTTEDQRQALPLGYSNHHFWPEALVQVDTNELYTITGQASITVEEVENPVKFASLDIDQKLIHPLHVSKHAFAADTALAANLNPGDTSFLLYNATGWSNEAWQSAESRALAWYGYTDSTGHTYADFSYTRNVAFQYDHGLWEPGAISFDGTAGAYRVELLEPWSGPALTAGMAVRNATGGAAYQVPQTVAVPVGADNAVEFAATVGGGFWQEGQRSENTFRPGTVYIQPVLAQQLPWTDLAIGPEQDVSDLGPLYFPKSTVDVAADGQFSLDLDVLAKDAFGGVTTLVINSVGAPEHGTATIVLGPDGHDIVRYQSPVGFMGTDVVVYTLRDTATGTTFQSTVAITVVDNAEQTLKQRLRNVGLAMINHADATHVFPVSNGDNFFDENGIPYVSWRVHLLRYLGYESLYNQFNLDEPWDSANNLPLLAQMPEEFRSIGDAVDSTTTRVQTFNGPDAPFGRLAAGEDQIGPRYAHFRDGIENTILFAEVGTDVAVPWTMPSDRTFDINDPLAALGTIAEDKFYIAIADGALLPLSTSISADDFKGLVTLDGDEAVDVGTLHREYLVSLGGTEAVNYFRANTSNRNKSLALAMHNYAGSGGGQLPGGDPRATSHYDENGIPYLSWRVSLLPYLGQNELYQQFVHTEPWDSPNNLPLLSQMPDVFRSAEDTPDIFTTRIQTLTSSRVPREPSVGFYTLPWIDPNGNLVLQAAARLGSFRDGTQHTILFVEAGVDRGVPWTKSQDLPFNFADPWATFGDLSAGEIHAAMADTNSVVLPTDLMPSTLTALATRASADLVDMGSIESREQHRTGQLASIYESARNLKNISFAMHNFADARRSFPYTSYFDEKGYPFLSWRVHILPYFGYDALYDQFRQDEPWDSPHNLALLEFMPDVFRSSGDPADSSTTHTMVFTGPGAPFLSRPEGIDQLGPNFASIRDGTANTIMLVEAGKDQSVPWTKPTDLPFWVNNPGSVLGELGSTIQTAMFDGRTEIYTLPMSVNELTALITHNGRELPTDPPITVSPNYFIYETGGDTTAGEFGVDWVDIVLDLAPTEDVVLELVVSNTAVAMIDKPLLTFTADNWNVPQRVAVRGVDNLIVNADRRVDISVNVVAELSDDSFDTVATQVIRAKIYDDELQPVPGDFDGNRRVDGDDLTVWADGIFLQSYDALAKITIASGDADGDKDVDGADFLRWQQNFGMQPIAGDFDFDEDVDAVDLDVWAMAVGEDASADLDQDGDSDGADLLAWQRIVPFENESPAAGDFNDDEEIDAVDLKIWEVSAGQHALADADGDGDSDGADFLAWQRGFSTEQSLAVQTASKKDATANNQINPTPLINQMRQSSPGISRPELNTSPVHQEINVSAYSALPLASSMLGDATLAAPLSFEKVDAAFAMNRELRMKVATRNLPPALLWEDEYDWLTLSEKTYQHLNWQSTSEIRHHAFRSRLDKVDNDLLTHEADETSINDELLDELFAMSQSDIDRFFTE